MLFVFNVRNMRLYANAASLRGPTYFILWLIYVVSGNHSVLNSPWGEGVLEPAQGLENNI